MTKSTRVPARARWATLRNRILASPGFQEWAARVPVIRGIARRRARNLFDVLAGFSHSQLVLAAVECGLLEELAHGPRDVRSLAEATGLSEDAALRLLRAGEGLSLTEEVAPGGWMLGQQGAVLHANTAAQAMIRHHRLLYADLVDPVALLRADRAKPTALSRFWSYAGNGARSDGDVSAYSGLMASSHTLVGTEARARYRFDRHRAVLDIGGGHGRFAALLAEHDPRLGLGIFDLPQVIHGASALLENEGLAPRISLHEGDFLRDPLPEGYDCHTLLRILHDHDDEHAAHVLAASRAALPTGGRLVIVEPMAGVRGAESVGSYFEVYLWAMGSGRPRRPDEIGSMLRAVGFTKWAQVRTLQPIVACIIVATV